MVSLRELCADIGAGKVQTLLLLGVNPVYDAPADFGFAELLGKVKLAVHLGLHDDETAGRCHWHVPAAHWLESWSDARSWDGTLSIVQPLIAPLYGGKTAHELLAALGDRPDRTAYELVRERFFREAAPTPVAPPVAAADAAVDPGAAAPAAAPPPAAPAAAPPPAAPAAAPPPPPRPRRHWPESANGDARCTRASPPPRRRPWTG
ncbi:MAG: hypothetical protein WKG00_17935 [Polyangiaceae bacterium]